MPDELMPLERAVIALSRNDPAWSLKRRGRLARWAFGRNFGPLPLADAKLEALRRYAILRRIHGSALAEQERDRLYDAGYDQNILEEIDKLILLRFVETTPFPSHITSTSKNRISKQHSRFLEYSEIIAEYLYPRLLPVAPQVGIFMKIDSRTLVNSIAVISAFPLALGYSVALAQTVSKPQAEPARQTDGQPEPRPEPPSLIPDGGPDGGPDGPGGGDRFAIGIGGIYQPAHMGAKDYRFQPLPTLDIKWGRFFVNFQDGIGATIIDTETVTIGAGITMADNYRAKDVPAGIGKLKFGAGARGFMTLRQFGFEATAGVTKIITGSTEGMIADFSLSRPIMVSERLFLNPSIGTRWANRKHNDRYFGVSEQQSIASGLPQFRVGSGLLDAKAELGLQYRLTDRIGVGLVGGVSTLLGDVKDSPIVEKKTAPYGIGFISYSF